MSDYLDKRGENADVNIQNNFHFNKKNRKEYKFYRITIKPSFNAFRGINTVK